MLGSMSRTCLQKVYGRGTFSLKNDIYMVKGWTSGLLAPPDVRAFNKSIGLFITTKFFIEVSDILQMQP